MYITVNRVENDVYIRGATVDDSELVIQTLIKSITTDEPVCRSLGISESDAEIFYRGYVPKTLSAGVSAIAFEGDQIMGILLSDVKQRGDVLYNEDPSTYSGRGMKVLCQLLYHLTNDFWKEMPPAVVTIVHALDIWVHPSKRRSLTQDLVHHSMRFYSSFKADAIVAEFLNSSRKIIFSTGFFRMKVIEHDKLKDENGQRLINCPTENSSCLGVAFFQPTFATPLRSRI